MFCPDANHCRQLGQALGEGLVLHAEGLNLLDEALVRGVDLGQRQGSPGLGARRTCGDHEVADRVRADLVQLVHDPQHRLDIGEPDTEVEPLRDLAVVDLDPEGPDR